MRKLKYVKSLVTGQLEYKNPLPTCIDERSSIFPWHCGKAGKYFVGKASAHDLPADFLVYDESEENKFSI